MKILLEGFMWNPSTCECQCDKWCKSGQYLDHKNCICKNKLIGRVIEQCTSVINETMINNKGNITNNNNTYLILFIVFLIGFIVFLIGFIYYYCRNNANKRKLRDFIYPKVKSSIYQIMKMDIKSLEIRSLEIKTKTTYDWSDIFYINDFDVNSLEIIKRESKIGANIYHIGYVFDPDYNAVKLLHFSLIV